MDNSAIAVFTFRGRVQMEEEGGSFAWVLNKQRAESCKYVICVRNRHNRENPPQGDEEHSHAFLVAENKGLEPRGDRWLIRFGRIASVDQHVEWKWHDKVYTSLSSFGIDKRKLERALIDVGCHNPFNRSGHSASPRHSPIVKALHNELKKLGWEVGSAQTSVQPDLVMTKGNRSILFEVKPDNSQVSFFTAIGQLTIYRHALEDKVDRAFVVAPDYPSAVRSSFEEILSELKLDLLRFSANGDVYTFPSLANII